MKNKKIWLILFTFFWVAISLSLVFYVQMNGGISMIKKGTSLWEIGKMMGTLGFLALAVVYGRTILKLAVRKDVLLKRLEPFHVDYVEAKTFLEKILFYLNVTHAYFGVMAIFLIFGHCYLIPSAQDNILLYAILVLMAIEGATGITLELRYSSPELKKRSYLFHSQMIVGFIIFILAIVGHALLKF
jgi:hypothetical protein